MKSQILTAMTMKIAVFWDVTPCSLTDMWWHVTELYCLQHSCTAIILAEVRSET